MAVEGLERAEDAQAFSQNSPPRAVKTDVIGARTDVADLVGGDPLLMRLVELWERLGPDERQTLLEAAERLAGEAGGRTTERLANA